MTPLFRLHQVSLTGPRRPRLCQVTLDIPPGRTVIIGPSGAGKTSLLNLLAGFESPDSGHIESGPRPANRLPLFWSPADGGLWPGVSIADHIRLVLPGQGDDSTIQQWLQRFDLPSAAAHVVEELSAGERSRLSIARALAADAAVLILDEPLVHVDPGRLDRYWRVIRDVCNARNTSLIFSSHHSETWPKFADHVIGVDNGRVVVDCGVSEAPREFPHG